MKIIMITSQEEDNRGAKCSLQDLDIATYNVRERTQVAARRTSGNQRIKAEENEGDISRTARR